MSARRDVVVERRVAVPPEAVFAYFTDAGKWMAWQGTDAEIELVPDGEGTLIRLTHSDLPEDQIEIHRYGWEHYVPRLASVAEGRSPGPNNALGVR